MARGMKTPKASPLICTPGSLARGSFLGTRRVYGAQASVPALNHLSAPEFCSEPSHLPFLPVAPTPYILGTKCLEFC